MTRLAVFGDSIAWGSWDPEVGGWTQRLKLHFMRRHPGNTEPESYVGVYPCAVPGYRAGDVASRIDGDLAAITPEAAVIAVGINDTPHRDYKGTPASEFDDRYLSILDSALAGTSAVFALTATNVHGHSHGYSNGLIAALNERVANLCSSRNVPVIDVFGVLKSDDVVDDGLHPNAGGHEKIYRRVREALG